MDILSEGCSHRQGVLGPQDHWAGATGDACGKMGVSRTSLTHLTSIPEKRPQGPKGSCPYKPCAI